MASVLRSASRPAVSTATTSILRVRVAQLEADLTAARRSLLLERLLREHPELTGLGSPDALATLLGSGDEETLTARAKRLARFASGNAAPSAPEAA